MCKDRRKKLSRVCQVVGIILFFISVFLLVVGNWYYKSVLRDALDVSENAWNRVCLEIDCTELGVQGYSLSNYSNTTLIYQVTWPVFIICSLILLTISAYLVLKSVAVLSET